MSAKLYKINLFRYIEAEYSRILVNLGAILAFFF